MKNADPHKENIQEDRMQYALLQLEIIGIPIESRNDTTIIFKHKGETVMFFPFTGWHSGKSIKDGRGISKLLKQLNP